MFERLKKAARRFAGDEAGLAFTEYLIILGLIASGTIVAITMFGTSLAALWIEFSEFVNRLGVPVTMGG